MLLSPFFFFLFIALVDAFSFSFSSRVQQCANLSVIWDGGVAPYRLLLVPVGALPGKEIRTIVDETINEGTSHSFQLKFPTNSSFIAMMSDSTGIGSGGTSVVITVLEGSTSDCLATSATSPLYYFYLDPQTNPAQCSNVVVSWDSSRTQGQVTIAAMIPGGQSSALNIPSSGTSFNWQVPMRQNTEFLLVAGDDRGFGVGGSSELFTVQSGSESCISANSPSSTAGPAAGGIYATGSGGGSVTGAPGSNDPSSTSPANGASHSKNNVGAIVGGTLGGVAFLLITILVLLLLRRRKNIQKGKLTRGRRRESVDLLNDEPSVPPTAAPPTLVLGHDVDSPLMEQISRTSHSAEGGMGQYSREPRNSTSSIAGRTSSDNTRITPIYARYSTRGSSGGVPTSVGPTSDGGRSPVLSASLNPTHPPSAYVTRGATQQASSTSESNSVETSLITNSQAQGPKAGLAPPARLRPVNIVQHEDAGEVRSSVRLESDDVEVVELPPQYNEIQLSRRTTEPDSELVVQ